MSPITLLLMVVLLACSWPTSRLLLSPAFRQVAPRQWLVVASLGGLAAAVIVILAVFQPDWFRIMAVVTIPLVGASAWRSRTRFGHSRGLPPGSLSPWRSIEAIVDREYYFRQAAQHGPVFKTAQFHQRVICVVGLDRGHRLLREHREKLGPALLPFNQEIEGGFLRYMDDSSHQYYSGLFRAAFSPPTVAASEPMTRAAAEKELADMAVSSGQGRAVSPESHLERFVSSSFLSVLFGVQPENEAFDRFGELYPKLGEQDLSSPFGDEAREALEELRHWVLREAEVLRARGSQQVQLSALGELLRADQKMPDPTAVDNLLFIYRIASSNVIALLRWVVKTLGDHPEWVTRLRGEIDSNTHADLSRRIVLETLRLAQSEYLYREIVEDFRFDEFTMPHKWLLRICVRESHGNPEVFREANTFDPDRFLNHSFDSSQYSPFGFGPHACNGSHLTMMIARNWIEELCGDFDWTIVQDGRLEREFRHWRHWRPSKSLAISISRRSDNR